MPSGARPGERRGGRKKGTPNKQSLTKIKAAIAQQIPDLDSITLLRRTAAVVRAEINRLIASGEYDPNVLIDWCLKLGRLADTYIRFEHPTVSPVEPTDRDEYNVQVRADLSRLNAEQLLALKHLALIASGGSTSGGSATTIDGRPNPPDGPAPQRKAGQRRKGKG